MIFNRRLILLALLPLAIYVLVYAVIDQARPTGIVFQTIDATAFGTVAAAEGRYRYYWLSAFILLTAVSLAVAGSAGLALFRETPPKDRGFAYGFVVIVALAVIAAEVFGVAERWYTYLGDDLFASIFAQVESKGEGSALSVFIVGQEVIKGSATLAIVLLAACLIMTLAQPPAGVSLAARAKHVAAAAARQRLYLQQAALVYVFAVLAMLSWMYWPLPFLADDAVRKEYQNLVMGAAVLQGVAFTLGVAAIYLPPALLLRQRSVALASAGADIELDDETRAAIGPLATHPFDQFKQVAVMLMPALVSLTPAITGLWAAAPFG